MDYYQTLGVTYTASHDEIKRAYRRLAVLYHPDKNRDPAAESIFKKINEAYDVLGDPAKKSRYDLRFQAVFEDISVEPPRRHRDPAYDATRPRPHRKSDRETLTDLMREYLPWAVRLTQLSFGFALLILVDFALPYHITQEKIVETNVRRTYSRNYATTWWVMTTNVGRSVDIAYEFSDHFATGREIAISSTMLFNVPRQVESDTLAVKLKKSIYGNFIFAPIALFAFSVLGIIFRKNVEYGFNLSIVSFLIFIFTLALLLIL